MAKSSQKCVILLNERSYLESEYRRYLSSNRTYYRAWKYLGQCPAINLGLCLAIMPEQAEYSFSSRGIEQKNGARIALS